MPFPKPNPTSSSPSSLPTLPSQNQTSFPSKNFPAPLTSNGVIVNNIYGPKNGCSQNLAHEANDLYIRKIRLERCKTCLSTKGSVSPTEQCSNSTTCIPSIDCLSNHKDATDRGESRGIVGVLLEGKNVLVMDNLITVGTAMRGDGGNSG